MSDTYKPDNGEALNGKPEPSGLSGGINHIKSFFFIKNNGESYKKKAFLYGYYGMNLGDDLFLEAVIKRYPDVLFLVLNTDEYYHFFKQFKNVKFYSYENRFVKEFNSFGHKIGVHDIFEHMLLLRCDAIVHIGGAIYQETADYLDDYNVRKRRSGICKRFFSLSSNFGPYRSDDFYKLWKKVFKKSYDICFRDKNSYALFKDLKSARYAPDVLFTFKSEPVATVAGSVSISVINPFLEVRNIPDNPANAYKEAIISTVKSLTDEKRIVNLLGFCKYEKDDEFISQILGELPDYSKEYVKVLNYDSANRDEMIATLSSSEYIIGTRLHSTVLGFTMGKKVLPVIYSDKVKNILEDAGFNGTAVTLDDMPVYSKTGLGGLLNTAGYFDIAATAKSAERQFEKLDKVLKRK